MLKKSSYILGVIVITPLLVLLQLVISKVLGIGTRLGLLLFITIGPGVAKLIQTGYYNTQNIITHQGR